MQFVMEKPFLTFLEPIVQKSLKALQMPNLHEEVLLLL